MNALVRLSLLVVVVGTVVLAAACPRGSTSTDAGAAATVKRIVVVTTAEPDALQPLLADSGAAHEVIALLARDLVVHDDTWARVPDLATAVPSVENGGVRLVEGKPVVTWRIRDDARWEDGAPVGAADFVLGWRVQMDPAQELVVGRDNAARIERLEPAADGRSFTVTWREPNPFFADPRVHRALPSHVVGARIDGRPLKDDALARQPLANGPFRLVEHAPGQHLLFKRNERHVPKAKVDEVVVKIVPSTTAALTLLQSGGADLAFPSGGPSPVEAKAFVARHPERFALAQAPGQVWTHVDMNLDDEWLRDVRVRRALAAALPRKQLFDAVSGGLYEVAETYLPPRHWGHATLEPLAFDREKAKALLDEAGWKTLGDDGIRKNKKGERLSLQLAAASGQPETEELLQLMRQAWKEVGVDVVLDLRPFKVFFGEGARKRKLPHMAFYAWTLDGASMGSGLWRADKIPSEDNGFKGQNFPGWKNDEATELLKTADATLDLALRQRMLRRVQELVREELPAIPMYFRPVVVVHDRRVTGLRPTGTQTPLAWNAAEWDFALGAGVASRP